MALIKTAHPFNLQQVINKERQKRVLELHAKLCGISNSVNGVDIQKKQPHYPFHDSRKIWKKLLAPLLQNLLEFDVAGEDRIKYNFGCNHIPSLSVQPALSDGFYLGLEFYVEAYTYLFTRN